MQLPAPFRRYSDWSTAHPWRNLGLVVLIGVAIVYFVPPRASLAEAAIRIGLWFALYLALNLLVYRRPFPTRDHARAERAKADAIAASVRRARDEDAARL